MKTEVSSAQIAHAFDTGENARIFPKMLSLTESAANEIRRLKHCITEPDSQLRIFVESGGCSGCSSEYHYGMSFDVKKTGDLELESQGMKIYIDPDSARLLRGVEIDYGKTPEGHETFLIKNPNASKTCGCGRSFSE